MGNCICIPPTPVFTDDVYKNSTDENTSVVSYENVKKRVKVLRVVDGDTLDIAMYQEETNRIYKYRVRLYGIDTPEKRPLKSDPNRTKEIMAAMEASRAMTQKIEECYHMVTIHFHQYDKYGRLLGTVYGKNEENLNRWMIQHGHATEYFGKTKKSFEQVSKERDEKSAEDNRA
jgi:endonuclease YncB( thermonuclease family)